MKKRLLSLALALALVLALCIVPKVSAEEDPVALAKQKILDGYTTGVTTVELGEYALKREQLEALYDELHYSNQLPWYAASYKYTYTEATGIVQTFTPVYLDEEAYDRGTYERRVAEILAETVHPGMTQLEAALAVHDYLIVNAQYDNTKTYYEGYDLLVRGTAVCNGYAEAYMDIMKRIGVECHYVISDAMDHGWNQVKLGDHWYHVDVTWDDPIVDRQGNVDHTYFMLSDEAIGNLERPHHSYEALHKSTDTTYDSGEFWTGVVSQICFESEDVYYYQKHLEKTVQICRNKDGEESVLYEFDAGVLDGNTIYRYKTKGLNLVNGRLYFCSGSIVYSMDTNGGDLREEHKEAANANYGILGCHLVGDTLELTTWDLKENYERKSVTLENISLHAHAYEESRQESACDQRGASVFACACGVAYKVEDASAPGHDYVEEVQQALTLTTHGIKDWTCSRCGDNYTETQYAVLSREFLTNWDNLRWILVGGVVLLILLGKIVKKK